MEKINLRTTTLTSLILVLALSRLFPVLPNFTPILSIALFGGAYFADKKIAYIIPLFAMFLSDVLLHFLSKSLFGVYSGFHPAMMFVYVSFALTVLIGQTLVRQPKASNVLLGSVASSIIFFLITNIGTWLTFGMYQMNLSGLLLCLEAGIPFYKYTLLSALVYSTLTFGAFSLAEKYLPNLSVAKN